jgi:hypothetical protein
MLLLAMFLAHDNERLELRVRSNVNEPARIFFRFLFYFFAISPQPKKRTKTSKNKRPPSN